MCHNGLSSPILDEAPSVDDEDEVLFLTSRDRIFDAFIRWYRHAGEDTVYSRAQALEMSRGLMRYLVVPTVEEISQYREEPISV